MVCPTLSCNKNINSYSSNYKPNHRIVVFFRYFATDTKWMVGEVIVGPSNASPAVPEFGSLAELVVLASIVGAVVVTRAIRF